MIKKRETDDKKQSDNKKETKIPEEYKFNGHDTIIGPLGEEIRKDSY